MTTRRQAIALIVAMLVLGGPPRARVGAAGAQSGTLLEGTIVTMNASRDVIQDGHVLVRDGRIAAIWSGSRPPKDVDLTGVVRVPLDPHAIISPGMINLHDHPHFNVLPLWRAPSSHRQPQSGRPVGTEAYANRYQWNTPPLTPEYVRLVSNPSTILTSSTALNRLPEVIKYGRARMILGGTTTTQGGGSNAAYDSLLARNVESKHFGRQKVFSRVPSINTISNSDLATLQGGMAAGLVDAWLVHLAEGVRDGDRPAGDAFSSRAEFTTLKNKGLLNDATVIVHGAGLEAGDFAEMAQAPPARADGSGDGRGAKLVWSPLSNLLLYGKTAAITDAIDAGVVISLGTDWAPSGSPNLLTELKIADYVLQREMKAHGTEAVARDRRLVEMVTINPAMSVRWDDQVGSIEVGKVADLMVINGKSSKDNKVRGPESVYRRLIDATERDVTLVMVGGAAQAGDVAVMSAVKGSDFEVVTSDAGCFEKAIDVTAPALPRGTQTLAEVVTLLGDALRGLGGDHPPAGGGPSSPFDNTWSDLKARIPGTSSLPDLTFNFGLIQFFGQTPDGKVNLEAIRLPGLFVADDHWWFSTLQGQADADPPYAAYPSNANHLFAPSDLSDRFYAAQCPSK